MIKFYIVEYSGAEDELEFRVFETLLLAQQDCCARILEMICESWDMNNEDERDIGYLINSFIKNNNLEKAIDYFNEYEDASGGSCYFSIHEQSFQTQPYKFDPLDKSFFDDDDLEENEEEEDPLVLH